MNELNESNEESIKSRQNPGTSKQFTDDESNWAEFIDESVLQLLDEPFSEELNHTNLRHDEQYRGFDNNAGANWIYPNNYPIRQYQYNITKAALFRNTLVVLPTGLGKTFIAAVVMYNIYRWYPTGKIIFMAPTKPLVSQQIEACRKIVGIPLRDTSEITGKQIKKLRRELWQSKRVFFATPQVVQNDVNDNEQNFPFDDIRLIVVDEAHKAKGHYAHAEAVKSIASRNPYFRVLALSATPGRNVEDILEIIRNLFISHLEIRWENSIDVVSYTFKKNIKTQVVPLGTDLTQIRNEFIDIIDPYVRYLVDNQVLSGSIGSMSRGSIVMEQKRFRELSIQHKHPNESQVKMNFSVCVSLYHALELLERHGVRVFLNFFDDPANEASNRYYVATNPKLRQFLEKVRKYVGPDPFLVNDQTMTNGKVPDIPDDLDFGHPKFDMVKECVLEHFKKNVDSKVIIFCEYRESVLLMYRALLQCRPQVKPKVFVGQGGTGSIRAVTQKQQLEVMEQFRSGICNTLIATSVAEEGIDIGEVDLIICFDINTRNPTRFVQRIGRTGRRRLGNIIIMATEGKEHSIMKEVLQSKDKLNQKIVKSSEVSRTLYKTSPRIVPPEFNPKCVELFMTNEEDNTEPKKSKPGKKSKPPKEPKQSKRKAKDAKATSSIFPVSQKCDVRNYFKKVELDHEDREIFSTARPETSFTKKAEATAITKPETSNLTKAQTTTKRKHETSIITKAETSSKSFSELNVSASNAYEIERILWKMEKLKKDSTLVNNDLGKIMRSSSVANPIKQLILKSNVNYIQEKWEAFKALNAVQDDEVYVLDDEELNLQSEISSVEKVVGQGKIEKFIQENKRAKDVQFEFDYSYIFVGLERRSFCDNIENFIDKRLKEKRRKQKREKMNEIEERNEAIEEEIPDNVEEEIVEQHESRYLSQLNELKRHKISDQSTPLRPIGKAGLLNVDNMQGKELFSFDDFDDDTDIFGIVEAENKANEAHKENNINQNGLVDKHDTASKDKDNFFDDDFDDFFVNSKLITEVEHIEQKCVETEAMDKTIANNNISSSLKENKSNRNSSADEIVPASQIEGKEDKRSSRLGIEDFDYTKFFEPFDFDDLAAIEGEAKINEKSPSKSLNEIEVSLVENKSNGSLIKFPEIPRQKSDELFSSNDKTFPLINLNQERMQNDNRSPPRAEPKSTETSPSVLSKAINIKRMRLTCSIRNGNSSPFVKGMSAAVNSPGIANGLSKSLTNSILPSQTESPIVMQRKAKRVINSDSDSEELPNSQENTSTLANRPLIKRRRLQRKRCQFIEDEAIVSGGESDSEQNIECSQVSQMQYDSVVVIDEEEDHPEVDMRAKYLESIRSPNKKGVFKIPAPRVYNDMSRIFSQAVPFEGNSVYKEDSFVISSDEEIVEEQMTQECPLERAEAILKARRRAKRNQNKNNDNCKFGMRRRNIQRMRTMEVSSEEEDDT